MATNDAHLSMLIDAASTAELRHFALGASNRLKYTRSVEGPSPRELQATEQALVVWKTAQQALEVYKASERWVTNRD